MNAVEYRRMTGVRFTMLTHIVNFVEKIVYTFLRITVRKAIHEVVKVHEKMNKEWQLTNIDLDHANTKLRHVNRKSNIRSICSTSLTYAHSLKYHNFFKKNYICS